MKLVVLTGAGISAESGLQTFRGADGLWEGHNVYDVATPEAWHKNPNLVQDFYNMRRKAVLDAKPNAAHFALAKLQQNHEVQIITQNIDNLHEKAGSKNILHLHGEITKSQSDKNPKLVYDIDGWELKIGDLCEKGSQLRPHIVWFGEPVPMIEPAANIVNTADMLVVIGTSLQVYPAAGLLNYTQPQTPVFVIDPAKPPVGINQKNVTYIQQNASTGVMFWVDNFLK
ncbi:MAG: NAD-dependent deacylase [Bacteroidia bacterium]|nr:NAD-dependent deacylase [Bacteroidia bacterium]